jgi:hypothetical protein
VIANLDRCNARTDLFNDCAALMTEYGWKNAFGIVSRQREGIRVTDACRDVTQQYFASFWAVQVNRFNFERLACFPGYCGTCLHRSLAPIAIINTDLPVIFA